MEKYHTIYIIPSKLKNDYGKCTVEKNKSIIRIDKDLKGFEKLSTEFHELTHQVLNKNKIKLTIKYHHKILNILEPLFIQLVKNELKLTTKN